MNGRAFLHLSRLYWRSERAFAYASRHAIVGQVFGRFGKRMGWSLLRARQLSGIRWVLVPVNITRYFEFAFVHAHILASAKNCLDLSSPALYSLYLASINPHVTIHMANPDTTDINATAELVHKLYLTNIKTENQPLHNLTAPTGGFDCIWSISVLEHIAGDYDDREGIQMLYKLLRKGGRLILTIPVDKQYWCEYREQNYYGAQQSKAGEKYFFQRFYDQTAIWERLLAPLHNEPSFVAWFGEKVNGRFHNYIQRWLNEGLDCIVEDPREIVDHYATFENWHTMPGVGVCGLVIDKPL